MTFLVAALFVSYMVAYLSFVYFGWAWSFEVATGQAAFLWAGVTLFYGALGIWLAVSVAAMARRA